MQRSTQKFSTCMPVLRVLYIIVIVSEVGPSLGSMGHKTGSFTCRMTRTQ